MVNKQCIGNTELKCGKHTMYRYYRIEMWHTMHRYFEINIETNFTV